MCPMVKSVPDTFQMHASPSLVISQEDAIALGYLVNYDQLDILRENCIMKSFVTCTLRQV
jgi:hypothetical protein